MGPAVLQVLVFLALLVALAVPLGTYIARVAEGDSRVNRLFGPLERAVLGLCGVRAGQEMHWLRYAAAMLWFNLLGLLAVYGLLRLQHLLALNPQQMPAVGADLSFNTAVSFATNTNWQAYGGESTLGYLAQMLGLGVQNFVSAASGIATLLAVIRGFTRAGAGTVGNFWVDLWRSTAYLLVPLSLVMALVLVSQGVVQTFSAYPDAAVVQAIDYDRPTVAPDGTPIKDGSGQPVTERATLREQSIAVGPAASQIAIKQLGTNGGGFFNVNSAHPFENPTPLSNLVEVLAIVLIPAALCFTFGAMVRDRRQGWAIFAAMAVVFVAALAGCLLAEQAGNPVLASLGVDQSVSQSVSQSTSQSVSQTASTAQSGGNMEGKEVRFGIVNSAIWATATTAASNGSVNAMHDSLMPLGGLVPMVLMQLGEVIFGGVGSGLYGMLIFAVVAVFVAGLMIGRTPEYLAKKIEAFEIKMSAIVVLVPLVAVLAGTGLSVMLEAGRAGIANPGPHGFSEVLYAFSSAANNNGSAFGGLSANTPYYNLATGLAMLFSRYWLAVPVLALAGSLAAKKRVPPGVGTLPTHTPLFVFFLVGVVLIVGALTFFPALALGPIVEHLMLFAGAAR